MIFKAAKAIIEIVLPALLRSRGVSMPVSRLQRIKALTLFTACLMLALVGSAYAQNTVTTQPETTQTAPEAISESKGSGVEILPAKSLTGGELYVNDEEDTHPMLRLTPDKSELIRLDKEAGTVVVGNPAHLSVIADSAKTLVLVPQAIGATYLVIMDRQGNTLMQRHVIVGSPKEKYVRIRKSCAGAKVGTCQATQVYYCPDMCHAIGAPTGEPGQGGGGGMDEKISETMSNIDQASDGEEETSSE